MIAETFKIKKIAVMREKRSYNVVFELAGGEWSNDFELPIKKTDTPESIQKAITRKVRDMVEIKDMENELMRTLTGIDIAFDVVVSDTSKTPDTEK